MRRLPRRIVLVAIVAAVVVASFAAALHVAVRALKDRVEAALRAESEVAAITLRWSSLDIEGIRMPAPKGWPARDALAVRRVRIVPDFRTLFGGTPVIRRVEIEGATLSALRTRDGRVRAMPQFTESARSGPMPAITLGTIELRDAAIEFWDAAVAARPQRLRIERVQGTVEHLRFPERSGRTRVDLKGVIKGVHRDGTLTLRGWTELSSRDTVIAARLRGADLVPFSPYLLTASDIAVRRGTLDLDLDATIERDALDAPGTVTLAALELASGSGRFMGVPRDALVSALKDRDGRIVVRFTVSGNVSDPKFSLRENLARRIGAALAESLGVDVSGLARSLGEAARGVGETVRKLFAN